MSRLVGLGVLCFGLAIVGLEGAEISMVWSGPQYPDLLVSAILLTFAFAVIGGLGMVIAAFGWTMFIESAGRYRFAKQEADR